MNKINIEFLQRVNDGNFQHREIKVSTVIEGDNEKVLGAHAQALTKFAKDVLDGKYASQVVEEVKEGEKTIKKVEPKLKNGKGEAVPEKDIKPVKETPAPVKEEEEEKEEVEAKKPKAKKETTLVTKGKAKKEETYDRTNDSHKNQVSAWLDMEFPGWDDDETIKTYGEATRKLVGVPFRDKEGEILESFKDQIRELVEA